MKITIDIPREYERDFSAGKFKDFFSRVIADIDFKGICGNYEKEIAEMFLEAFDKAIIGDVNLNAKVIPVANISFDKEDMQKMIRNVENAKDSYAELSAYQTELKRIQDALREDGYVNVESFSNKLEAMNQQSEQLMKDYDRFLKNVSQDVAELQNKIETRRKAGGV